MIVIGLAAALMITACTVSEDPALVREELMQADRDFAAETAERGGDGWADWFAADGVMLTDSGTIQGQEKIREAMKAAFAPGNPRLTWDPVSADVGSGGDFGYTRGRWASVKTLPDGSDSTLATGNYISIWRKVPDEGWKVVLDIGNDAPE
jgi:ketosteroid isomerase-like protein